ncbi:DUF3024 domain-containing protein [Paenibacillus macerans]|nr:DUF3024 domain-containing protein [Paenibacillus macerans]MCM3701643.1 DUF3024 domain-containing protein [Paenibacillus macerans]
MIVDEFTARRLENILDGYIEVKVPREVRSSIRLKYEWDDKGLILLEERPHSYGRQWHGSAVAQFRLERGQWSVYANNANREWERVQSIAPCSDFEQQLEQVELDPEGIFWPSLKQE